MARRLSQWLLASALGASILGCAATDAPNSNAPNNLAASAPSAQVSTTGHPQPLNFAGVWEGTSVADCFGAGLVATESGRCSSMQNITLTMFQDGATVTGFYRCAFGTQNCRNLDDKGVIKNAHIFGRRLTMRVMLEDGSMCFFSGMSRDSHLIGGYMCLQGAGIVEEGRFTTQRSY